MELFHSYSGYRIPSQNLSAEQIELLGCRISGGRRRNKGHKAKCFFLVINGVNVRVDASMSYKTIPKKARLIKRAFKIYRIHSIYAFSVCIMISTQAAYFPSGRGCALSSSALMVMCIHAVSE